MNFDHPTSTITSIQRGAQTRAGLAANQILNYRNWLIGATIIEFEQGGEDRAAYGEGPLLALAERLWQLDDKGMSHRNPKNFKQVTIAYPILPIGQTPSATSSSIGGLWWPGPEGREGLCLQGQSGFTSWDEETRRVSLSPLTQRDLRRPTKQRPPRALPFKVAPCKPSPRRRASLCVARGGFVEDDGTPRKDAQKRTSERSMRKRRLRASAPLGTGKAGSSAHGVPASASVRKILPMKYLVEVEIGTKPGECVYNALVPALPGCFTTAMTIDEMQYNLSEAINLWLEAAREHGRFLSRQYTLILNRRAYSSKEV